MCTYGAPCLQALTWRYIQLMPELGKPPVKNREDKYHIIGRAYSVSYTHLRAHET